MSYRQTVAPTVTERPENGGGTERVIKHASFATVNATRTSCNKMTLFDSNINHDGYITLSFQEAEMIDGAYGSRVSGHGRSIFEVAMSENQFVGLVTRMNMGSGIPCTIQHGRTGPLEIVPDIGAFEDSAEKLKRKSREIHQHGVERVQSDVAKLKELLLALPKKKQEEAGRIIEYMTSTTLMNLDYGKDVLQETADKLVTEAKVEINATVQGIITQLGVDSLHQLTQIAAGVRVDNHNLLGKDNG